MLPGKLRLLPTRPEGADDYKLAMQKMEYGASVEDMTFIEALAGANDELIVFNGVTCATRAHRYHPDKPVIGEVTDNLPHVDMSRYRTVGEVHDDQRDAEW